MNEEKSVMLVFLRPLDVKGCSIHETNNQNITLKLFIHEILIIDDDL